MIAPRLLATHGSAAQKDRFLGPIAEGALRFALAALEPQARYDLHDVRTRAERRGRRLAAGRRQVGGAARRQRRLADRHGAHLAGTHGRRRR